MLMALTILYELANAATVLLILALCAAALSKAPLPVRAVRALCLLVWAWLVGWFGWGRPEQSWLLGYELATLLFMAGGCVFLWVIVASGPEPEQPAPPPVTNQFPKINGVYKNETPAVRSRHIRAKYRKGLQ